MVSHISTCKHFIIPWGATTSESNHGVPGLVRKHLCWVACIPAKALPVPQINSYNLTQQCSWPDRSAGMLRLPGGISNSLKLWWMWKEQIIIYIPKSPSLQTHRTPCYHNTLHILDQDVLPYDGLNYFLWPLTLTTLVRHILLLFPRTLAASGSR